MACNCPGSGCQCVEISGDTVSVTGSGSAGNPYVHEAIICEDADNILEATDDGLCVHTPCFLVEPENTVTNGNVLVEGDCSVDRLEDPPAESFLGHDTISGNAAWIPLIASNVGNQAVVGANGGVYVPAGAGSTVTDPCDVADTGTQRTQGNVLIQGGVDCKYERLTSPTVCQFLGYVGGQAGWVDPSIVEDGIYGVGTAIINEINVPQDGVFHQTTTTIASFVNNGSCRRWVGANVATQLVCYPLPALAPGSDLLGEHDVHLESDRDVNGNLVAFTNTSGAGHVWNFVSSTVPAGPIAHMSHQVVWCRLDPGDTANFRLRTNSKNTANMDPLTFSVNYFGLNVFYIDRAGA